MPEVEEIWNQLFQAVLTRKASLSSNLFFAYPRAWENFQSLSRRYLFDERREWTALSLRPTERPEFQVLEFVSGRRHPTRFLLEHVGTFGGVLAFQAYTTAVGSVRGSTIESFVDWASGLWFPRLSYRFMDDLTTKLKGAFPGSSVEMNEFVANVFERKPEGGLTKHQTIRTWVQREGAYEYNLFRSLNYQINRIVTLSGARFNIDLPEERGWMDVRVDHTARALLSTPHFDEYRVILGLLCDEAATELERYQVRKRLQQREAMSDLGERVFLVDYAGTDTLVLRISEQGGNWFDSLRAILLDPRYLTETERIVPFVVTDETNPLIQAQLVDLEAQASYTMTASKEESVIYLAPDEAEAHGESMAKIVNVVEKVAGATAIQG